MKWSVLESLRQLQRIHVSRNDPISLIVKWGEAVGQMTRMDR